jgi:hypothetical protein
MLEWGGVGSSLRVCKMAGNSLPMDQRWEGFVRDFGDKSSSNYKLFCKWRGLSNNKKTILEAIKGDVNTNAYENVKNAFVLIPVHLFFEERDFALKQVELVHTAICHYVKRQSNIDLKGLDNPSNGVEQETFYLSKYISDIFDRRNDKFSKTDLFLQFLRVLCRVLGKELKPVNIFCLLGLWSNIKILDSDRDGFYERIESVFPEPHLQGSFKDTVKMLMDSITTFICYELFEEVKKQYEVLFEFISFLYRNEKGTTKVADLRILHLLDNDIQTLDTENARETPFFKSLGDVHKMDPDERKLITILFPNIPPVRRGRPPKAPPSAAGSNHSTSNGEIPPDPNVYFHEPMDPPVHGVTREQEDDAVRFLDELLQRKRNHSPAPNAGKQSKKRPPSASEGGSGPSSRPSTGRLPVLSPKKPRQELTQPRRRSTTTACYNRLCTACAALALE